MSDASPPPNRLDALHFLERVQERDLDRTRRWIAAEEQRQAEQERAVQARPPSPDWVVEVGIGKDRLPLAVHVGGCHMMGKRSRGITRDQALQALTDGVEACGHCRPDTELGMLE